MADLTNIFPRRRNIVCIVCRITGHKQGREITKFIEFQDTRLFRPAFPGNLERKTRLELATLSLEG